MYVWFYVLIHSKYPFSVSCGLYRNNERDKKTYLSWCKIRPTERPRFRCPPLSAPVRSPDFFSAPDGRNIAHGKDCPGSRFGVFSKFSQKNFRRGFLLSPDNSKVYLCPTNCVLSDKGPRSAGPGRSPESNAFLTDIMDTDRELTDITDRKPRTPSYKYSFRRNKKQNIRFNELLCKVGLEHNRSRLIVKRIFGEEFVVVRRDPSKTQFIARLNDFYFQFQKLANNCAPVKVI